MSRGISPRAWFEHLETFDSTSAFISAGGSCIRVATVENARTHDQLSKEMQSFASAAGMRLLHVSHATCPRLHMPHIVLRSLAPSLSLEELFKRLARRVWAEAGFPSDGHTLESLRTQYPNEDGPFLRQYFNSTLRGILESETHLSHEFASVARFVTLSVVESPARGDAVTGLFQAALQQTASRKDLAELGMLRPIHRFNATPALLQLMALHKVAGWPGVVLHLDLRWTTDPHSLDETVLSQPTRSNRNDIYQWVRELIDLTSEFTSTFICAEFGQTFLDPSPFGQGMGSYEALRLRLDDGVKPKGGPNPSAVLVPLEAL